jgi:hypothetical protein
VTVIKISYFLLKSTQMKKFLLAGNIVLFVLLLMAHRPGDHKSARLVDPDIILGIDPQLSRQMVADYRDNIWNNRKVDGVLQKDSRSVWFSLEKLKAFIAEIENKVQADSCNQEKALGIRFYFAAYPDSNTIKQKGWKSYFTNHGLPLAYQRLHTLVMVPTYYNDNDGHNYDFDPRFRSATGSCSYIPMKDVMNSLLTPGVRLNIPGVQIFSESLVIPSTKSFMLMTDNRDTRRNKYGFKRAGTKLVMNGGGGNGSNVTLDESLNTNGGTLIPPPFGAQTPPGMETMRVINSPTKPMFTKIHIPSSGASYMRWVDDTNDTGWVNPPIRKLNASSTIKGQGLKVQ